MDKKKIWVAIFISDKIDFKAKAIKRDTERYFIILKGRIHHKDTNIINIYALNIGAPKYIRKILEDFKKDVDSNTFTIGDFNTPLSTTDRFPFYFFPDRFSKQRIKIYTHFKCTWNIFFFFF